MGELTEEGHHAINDQASVAKIQSQMYLVMHKT